MPVEITEDLLSRLHAAAEDPIGIADVLQLTTEDLDRLASQIKLTDQEQADLALLRKALGNRTARARSAGRPGQVLGGYTIGTGQQLGGYTVLNRIGQGGMGDVYLAQHRRISRRAAVKVLLPELSQKASVLDRFFNEARATSLIKHPGIVEILDCDVLGDQAFIIMEYLEGESLGQYQDRTGALGQDPPFLLGVAAGIASAVGAAHGIGIIHRDLKPDNIYLHLSGANDPTATVKILDFGIAKLAQQESGTSQKKSGLLLGTPAYMSPEQCRGAGGVDRRSDIYSLGCILYEMVCGAPPFVYESAGDMIIAHVSEPPQPPIARVANVAPALNALILRMLAKKPEQRPQSMDEVLRELGASAAALGTSIDRPLRPRTPIARPAEAAQVSAGPTVPGGLPRSRLTVLPELGSSAARGGVWARSASRPTTTMASAAAEISDEPPPMVAAAKRGRMFAVVAATVALVAGIIAVLELRHGFGARNTTAGPVKLTPVIEPAPDSRPPVDVAEDAPATVRIDLQGLPTETTVTVDGHAAKLPLQLPRGPEVHRIVLRPPSGGERTLEVDGTKDRSVELVFDKQSSSLSSPSLESGHQSSSHGNGSKKTAKRHRDGR